MLPPGPVVRSLFSTAPAAVGDLLAASLVGQSRPPDVLSDPLATAEFAAVQFAAVTFVVLAALLSLSIATARSTDRSPALPPVEADGAERPSPSVGEFSAGLLLVNVAVTHGLLGAVLIAAAVATGVPAAALGLGVDPGVVPRLVGVGIGLGGVLYLGNEGAMWAFDRLGIGYEAELRDALTPGSPQGWVALLGFALPIVAGFEELLFRASLIGVLAAGFGVPVAVLAAFSSLTFAVGHGLQGPGGVVVAGLLGVALAGAFLVTGSIVVVVVAHYVINALEFLVHARR